MTLAINTTIPEGIILAADSRQSYRNLKGMTRIWSDSASKVIQLGKNTGLVISGLAFLPEGNVFKNISKFVADFKEVHDIDAMSVEQIAIELHLFFEQKYDYKSASSHMPKKIEMDLINQWFKLLTLQDFATHFSFDFLNKEGVRQSGIVVIDQLQFILAGFNSDKSHEVFTVSIPGTFQKVRDSKVAWMEYGANWIWQTDVISRLVLWFDPRVFNLPSIQQAFQWPNWQIAFQQQFNWLQYNIEWGTMTLQDAVDFSILGIETTGAIQRFSDGVLSDPGDMPGVGGPIDIAVILPEGNGFKWIKRKKIVVGNSEIDLEEKAP